MGTCHCIGLYEQREMYARIHIGSFALVSSERRKMKCERRGDRERRRDCREVQTANGMILNILV